MEINPYKALVQSLDALSNGFPATDDGLELDLLTKIVSADEAAPGSSPAAPGSSPAAPGSSPAAPGSSPAAPGSSQAAPVSSQAAPGLVRRPWVLSGGP